MWIKYEESENCCKKTDWSDWPCVGKRILKIEANYYETVCVLGNKLYHIYFF